MAKRLETLNLGRLLVAAFCFGTLYPSMSKFLPFSSPCKACTVRLMLCCCC